MDSHNYEKLSLPAHPLPPGTNPNEATAAAPHPYVAAAPVPSPYPPQQFPQQYPPPTPPPQYLSTTGPAPPGQPYVYPPPPAGYPPQQAYVTPQYGAAPPPPQPQHQLQQQQVVVVSGANQHPVFVQHVQSFVGHIVFACIVLWLCNWVFGLIAFILAGQYSFCYYH